MVLVSSIHRDVSARPPLMSADPRFFDRARVGTVERFLPRFGRLQQLTPPVKVECKELTTSLKPYRLPGGRSL